MRWQTPERKPDMRMSVAHAVRAGSGFSSGTRVSLAGSIEFPEWRMANHFHTITSTGIRLVRIFAKERKKQGSMARMISFPIPFCFFQLGVQQGDASQKLTASIEVTTETTLGALLAVSNEVSGIAFVLKGVDADHGITLGRSRDGLVVHQGNLPDLQRGPQMNAAKKLAALHVHG